MLKETSYLIVDKNFYFPKRLLEYIYHELRKGFRNPFQCVIMYTSICTFFHQ